MKSYIIRTLIGWVVMVQFILLVWTADKQYILKKCPYLLNEMISAAHQLFIYDQAGRGISPPLINCLLVEFKVTKTLVLEESVSSVYTLHTSETKNVPRLDF